MKIYCLMLVKIVGLSTVCDGKGLEVTEQVAGKTVIATQSCVMWIRIQAC